MPVFLRTLCGVFILLFATAALAVPELGKDYSEVTLADGQKPSAEIVEFFWYGAPGSAMLNDVSETLLLSFPELEWQRIPAVVRSDWRPQAKAYYLAKLSPKFVTYHQQLFEEMTSGGEPLSDQTSVVAWFAARGENSELMMEQFLSSRMNAQLVSDKNLLEAVNVPGVPAVLVNGRYLVHAGQHLTRESFLSTLEFLVALPKVE
ncbi:DsbA family protein [Corallincola platygyrae]|uniref:DsbA family protein n=1 Tax=Corallincola platygyrae TaxID=1193278 RepID=A0ABW4XNF4_9GAMM